MVIMKKILKQKKGAATLELLIAFAILILNITAVMLLVSGGQSIYTDSETNTEAIDLGRELIDKARADADLDFNLVNPYITTENIGSLAYTKTLEVAPGDNLFTKEVTSIISWVMGARTLDITVKTLLTNPNAVGGGDTCSSALEGDWTDPLKDKYELGAEILGDTSSGFPITHIQTFDKKLYLTVNNDNGNNAETFIILDITDPTDMPGVLGKFDNSPGISEGLNAVAVDGGDYAYVANAYGSSPQACAENHNCAQLQVIDIDPPGSVSVVRNKKINSVASGNRLARGTSIFHKDGVIYLGLANATSGNEFFILDVGGGGAGGSPTNPLVLSSVEIGNGINSIFVRNNYAYLASPNSQELKIYNVTSLSSPSPAGYYNAPTGGGNGKSMYLVGNKLYLGITVPNSGNDFHILNNFNSDIALPELGGMNSASSINGVIIRDYLAFLITGDGEFQTWRIDNPGSITQYANPLTLPPGTGGSLSGTASDCEGNYIFVGSNSSNDKGWISIITGS